MVSLRFDNEAMGQPQRWTVHHRGQEYVGEVIVSETVDFAWGQPLEGDLSFRVVFFTVPRRIQSARILDRRIAMAVPQRPPSEQRQSVEREVRSIHEARAHYITGRTSDEVALRRSMERREESLRSDLMRRYAVAYSDGRVYSIERRKAASSEVRPVM